MNADTRIEKRGSEQSAIGSRARGEHVLVERELALRHELHRELRHKAFLETPLAHALVRAAAQDAGLHAECAITIA